MSKEDAENKENQGPKKDEKQQAPVPIPLEIAEGMAAIDQIAFQLRPLKKMAEVSQKLFVKIAEVIQDNVELKNRVKELEKQLIAGPLVKPITKPKKRR